jgi:hypothetical protein
VKVDELIREHAHGLQAAYAHHLAEVPTKRGWRRGWVVALAAAVVVVLVIAPVALLLGSGSDEGPVGTPTEVTAQTSVPEAADLPVSTLGPSIEEVAELSGPLFLDEGDFGLRPVLDTDSGFLVSGWFTTVRSTNGETWDVVGGGPEGDDSLLAFTTVDGVAIAVGAHDGATARLYRSEDLGATWEIRELPADEGTTRIVVHVVSTDDFGFIVAGVGTTSSFDNDNTLYVWRSPDGIEWTVDRVADMGAEFTFAESITSMEGATIVVAQTFSDRLLAFEHDNGEEEWALVDLTPILKDEAGISSDLVNATFVSALNIDGDLSVWWQFNNGGLGGVFEEAAAVVTRTGPGPWTAGRIDGLAPASVTSTAVGFMGTAYPGTDIGTPAAASSLLVSVDGLAWHEIARFDGVALGALHQIQPGEFIATGTSTVVRGEGDEAYVDVTGGGIWHITFTRPLDEIINP